MKNILTKIYIHPITYIVFFITMFTGLYKELLLFLLITVIHESGHIIGSLICRWKIDKIILLPFGGLIKFNELINKPLREELLVLILGPLFQIVSLFLIKDINYRYYGYGLLLFNLLPIYPLDGYKLFNIILELLLPFKVSMKIGLIISFLLIFFLLRYNLIIILILFFLLIGVIKEFLNINNIYNKFLLERYMYNLKFKRRKIINSINNMYKDCYHIIKKNTYITEYEFLKRKYGKKP